MQGILSLVVLVLDVLAWIDVWKSSKESGKKILWTLLILVLPLIGLCIYFFAGREKK